MPPSNTLTEAEYLRGLLVMVGTIEVKIPRIVPTSERFSANHCSAARKLYHLLSRVDFLAEFGNFDRSWWDID